MKIPTTIRTLQASALLLILTACASETPTFSLLSDTAEFKQSNSVVNSKVDILWVVDNSGSMGPFQQRVRQNFDSFMKKFVSHGYDFQVAVTTSDAYRALPQFANYPLFAKFRNGAEGVYSKYFVVNSLTPNPIDVFNINANQGENGSGDERVFSSMKAALNSSLNSNFPRDGAFLAVIMLADEDDFSDPNRPEGSWQRTGGVPDHSYTNPGLETIASYVTYLDQKTQSTGATRRYSVSAVTVYEQTCYDQLRKTAPSTQISKRIVELVNATGGSLGNICDPSYATALDDIQQRILELADQFYLARRPVISSIVVTVNGVAIPQDAVNGWTYQTEANSIMFHGSALPSAGASIHVDFDPAGIM